jgi:two-component sensor histidine kinase
VRDTGVGLPEDARLEDAPTLGLRLVSTLARQLNGRLEIRNSAGAEFRITFPDHSRRTEQEHACCQALGG